MLWKNGDVEVGAETPCQVFNCFEFGKHGLQILVQDWFQIKSFTSHKWYKNSIEDDIKRQVLLLNSVNNWKDIS